MRIVVDMQGAQNGSRYRGIGRYTISFVKALIQNKGSHEIVLLLNGLFPESIEYIHSTFFNLIPQENIKIWEAYGPVHFLTTASDWRRKSAQLLREAYVESLEPDVLIVSSLFEGAGDNSVTSIGEFNSIFTAVVLYDLIPLLNEQEYLNDKNCSAWYFEKIKYCRSADLWLAISESSKREGISHLSLPEAHVENISAAIESEFSCKNYPLDEIAELKRKFGIMHPFLLYSGATDPRKNIDRLISAYQGVSPEIREQHQLVLAGGMPGDHLRVFKKHLRSVGLREKEVVFTGRVTDEELIALYNLCKGFILPSLHEGFGLPALEAMACGAATIGSNLSSIPEVIGLDAALFDPFSISSMTEKITQVLQDENFRKMLKNHGLERSGFFSWDRVASSALSKLEAMERDGILQRHQPRSGQCIVDDLVGKIGALGPSDESDLLNCAAAIAPLAPRKDSRPRLFVDVSELCRRDLGTGIQRVVRSVVKCLLESNLKKYKIALVCATESEPYSYAVKLSKSFEHPGSTSNDLESGVIDARAGDVFLGLDFQDEIIFNHASYYERLRRGGVKVGFVVYDLLPLRLNNIFSDAVKANYTKWLSVVTDQDIVVCISKAVSDELREWVVHNKNIRESPLTIRWFHLGADIKNSVPTLGVLEGAEKTLAKLSERLTFLVVGTIEPRKRQGQILAAFDYLWAHGVQANIVFVGREGWLVDDLVKEIRNHPMKDRSLFWLQGISDEYLERVYAVSTCLIFASEAEGFGLPLIEAAQHKLPIIARDIPVFREIAQGYAYYFSGFEPEDLANAVDAWLKLYDSKQHPESEGMPFLSWRESTFQLLKAMNVETDRQLMLDVSELATRDAGTGVQRVVKGYLMQLLLSPPAGFRVEPIYAGHDGGYRYARQFTRLFLGGNVEEVIDEPIKWQRGDIFFGLDMQHYVQLAHREFYRQLQFSGVTVKFLVYDLLPIQLEDLFKDANIKSLHEELLKMIAGTDGAICISKATADVYNEWIAQNRIVTSSNFQLTWLHIGGDIESSHPSSGIPVEATAILRDLSIRPSFLCVATIEPRKAQKQIMGAFDILWERGIDVSLLFVGKHGWKSDTVVEQILNHPEKDTRLFWLEGITDEYLEKIYGCSTCLIAASLGEGFGLPLVEAAKHKLPIVARDIPVFREVAGECAYYFSGITAEELADAISDWLQLYGKGRHPMSINMRWLTWEESTTQLISKISEI